MLLQKLEFFLDDFKTFSEKRQIDSNKIKTMIEQIAESLGDQEIFTQGLTAGQIWSQVKMVVQRQKKIVKKIERKQQEQKLLSKQQKEIKEKSLSEDRLTKEEDQINEETSNLDEQQEASQSQSKQEQEDYEDFMNELEGKDLLEEESEEDDQQDENESQNQEEENASQSISEDVEDVFRSMEHGVRNISQIEQKMLGKKDWTLKGEVLASQRDKDGLVDKELEFDSGVKHTIVITQEVNMNFEEILRQRIQDKTFDDRSITEFQKTIGQLNGQQRELPNIDFQKNTKSLAEIEEDKLKKRMHSMIGNKDQKQQQHDKIKDLFKQICYSIDQMSRLHFTPQNNIQDKNDKEEDNFLKIEKVPVVMQTASNKDNIKEVHQVQNKDLFSKTEMNQQDKKSLQRKIKKIK